MKITLVLVASLCFSLTGYANSCSNTMSQALGLEKEASFAKYIQHYVDNSGAKAKKVFTQVFKGVPLSPSSKKVLSRFKKSLQLIPIDINSVETVTLFRAIDSNVELLKTTQGELFDIPYYLMNTELKGKDIEQVASYLLAKAENSYDQKLSLYEEMLDHSSNSEQKKSLFISTSIDPETVFNHLGTGRRILVIKVAKERLNFSMDPSLDFRDLDSLHSSYEGEVPLLFGSLPGEIVDLIQLKDLSEKSKSSAIKQMKNHLSPLDHSLRKGLKLGTNDTGWVEEPAQVFQKLLSKGVSINEASSILNEKVDIYLSEKRKHPNWNIKFSDYK